MLNSPVLPQRFWDKVQPFAGPLNSPCWIWIGAITGDDYSSFWLDGKAAYGHIVAFRELVGAVPAGLELDHLCRVRPCVHPLHLEPVPRRTNLLRGINRKRDRDECSSGHQFTSENTYITAEGARRCRTCARDYQREYARARRAEKR